MKSARVANLLTMFDVLDWWFIIYLLEVSKYCSMEEIGRICWELDYVTLTDICKLVYLSGKKQLTIVHQSSTLRIQFHSPSASMCACGAQIHVVHVHVHVVHVRVWCVCARAYTRADACGACACVGCMCVYGVCVRVWCVCAHTCSVCEPVWVSACLYIFIYILIITL